MTKQIIYLNNRSILKITKEVEIMYKSKKAQAAMEFLTTYGWAILVVLAAIAALAYFGVLSPDKFLPEKCIFSAGLHCKSYKATTTGVTLMVGNALGKDVTVSGIELKDVSACSATYSNTSVVNGADGSFDISCTLTSGSKLKSDVKITYNEVGGLSGKIHEGSIVTKVQ